MFVVGARGKLWRQGERDWRASRGQSGCERREREVGERQPVL